MIISSFFITLATSMEVPPLFPFSFNLHLTYCIVALIFFVFRFVTDKQIYQAILAVAIPFSLTLWISSARSWFYTVGLIELIFLIAAFIFSTFLKKKQPQPVTEQAEGAEGTEGTEEKNEVQE